MTRTASICQSVCTRANMSNRAVSKTVYAQAGHIETSNNLKACAERRLLEMWYSSARRHDVPFRERMQWIRRKTRHRMVIWRNLADGRLACAAPCDVCRDAMKGFKFQVKCSMNYDSWFIGYLDEAGAPPIQCIRRPSMYCD